MPTMFHRIDSIKKQKKQFESVYCTKIDNNRVFESGIRYHPTQNDGGNPMM